MNTYEFRWSAYGSLEVEAETRKEALEVAQDEIHEIDEFGTDLLTLEVLGSEVPDD